MALAMPMAHGNADNDHILADMVTADKARMFEVVYRCAGDNRAALLAPLLKDAVFAGEADLLAIYLALGGCANTVFAGGDHVLHLAAAFGNEQVIRVLLQSGALVNALDGQGRNALQLLADNGEDNPDAAAVLLASGADPRHRRSEDDCTALELAVYGRSIAILKTILQHGVNPQNPMSLGYTALHTAAARDEVGAIRVMVEAGESVDVLDGRGQTPLHVAVAKNSPGAVRMLCILQADKEKLNGDGCAPLHLGMVPPLGSPGAVAELLQAGANANVHRGDEGKYTALDLAASLGNTEMVQALLDHGAEARGVDAVDCTALHVAAKCNKAAVINVLVKAGADVHASDADQQTPLHYACECLQVEAADALLGHGASINAPDHWDDTPLHRAARTSHEDNSARMVDFLLKRGANATAVDFEGHTPVEVMGRDAQHQHLLRHQPLASPSVRKLLVNAAAWRRRGFLVMCRAHPARAEPRLPEHLAGGAMSHRAGDLTTQSRARKVARVEGRGGGVAGNNNGGGGGIAHGEAAGGASVAEDVVAAVVGLQDDDVFRNVVGFL